MSGGPGWPALAAEERTLVLFEAPHRLAETLVDAVAAFGADRSAAVCRELTKTYEEVRRGALGELAGLGRGQPVRGEITLVVAGAPVATPVALSDADLAELVAAAEADGMPRKEAIAAVAAPRTATPGGVRGCAPLPPPAPVIQGKWPYSNLALLHCGVLDRETPSRRAN